MPFLPAMFSCGPVISPCAVTGCVWSLIVSSPWKADVVAVARDARRAEPELRVLLGVEEVRRAEVALEVLVLDDDRSGVDGADELSAVVGHGERGVEGLEPPAEGGDDHVLDREARGRVGRICVPGADRKTGGVGGGGSGGHLGFLSIPG